MQLWDIYHADIPDFLAEAAQTPEMQRLGRIGMNCGCEYTSFPLFAGIAPYSRYDHSMGAALIVWHFTHDYAQAMAALLHDIATPAFAHVIDFLHGDHLRQEFTEDGTAGIIRSSKAICRVCSKYGIPVDAVCDYHQYPIADNDSPRLSADRLEYTLSNAVNYGIVPRIQAAEFYADLAVASNEFGETELSFRQSDIALAFAAAALKCSEIYVSAPDRFAMQSLANLLKQAIYEHILTENDLYCTEGDVISKLTASHLSAQWQLFRSYSEIITAAQPDSTGIWLQIPAKKRFIDPYVNRRGRVSSLFPEFANQLHTFRTMPQNEWLSAR